MKGTTLTLIAIGVLFITGLSGCGVGGGGTTTGPTGPTVPVEVKATALEVPEAYSVDQFVQFDLPATTTPLAVTEKVTCTSSDNNIVSVDGGCKVTGLVSGDSAQITARVGDIVATSTVTVCANFSGRWDGVESTFGLQRNDADLQQSNCKVPNFFGSDDGVVTGSDLAFPPRSNDGTILTVKAVNDQLIATRTFHGSVEIWVFVRHPQK